MVLCVLKEKALKSGGSSVSCKCEVVVGILEKTPFRGVFLFLGCVVALVL